MSKLLACHHSARALGLRDEWFSSAGIRPTIPLFGSSLVGLHSFILSPVSIVVSFQHEHALMRCVRERHMLCTSRGVFRALEHLAVRFCDHLDTFACHVPRRQRGVRCFPGALRRQLLHPAGQHATWCAAAGSRRGCAAAKCCRHSGVRWILEPSRHRRCPGTAGRSGHHPACPGGRPGERRGRVSGQLHGLPCWWQQQHRG